MLRKPGDPGGTGLLITTLLIILQNSFAEVYLNLLSTPWQFDNVSEWDQRTCSFDVVNGTNRLRKTEGLRFTVPNKPTTFVSYDNPAVDVTAVNDGNGPDRYTARISGMNTNGTAYLNAIKANSSLRINLTCSGIQAGTDFTPVKHQYLVKTGSITGDKGYKDAPPISVDIIDSLISLPWFYDTDLYIPDSLGIQGGTYTGGFIDTWYDQAGDSSLWQIQICLPDDYFTVNGEPAKYRPDIMGQNDASGAGPMYAMSLAMMQEYMNVDMQIIAGCSPNESYGGVEMFTDMGGPDFVSQGCKYIANKGASGGTGPANLMDAPYNENVYVSYPKFLPYATGGANPDQFCATPGNGASCLGNSPQMANALLLSALYMWNTYDRMVNATDFWAKDLFNKAADPQITAKMVLSAWNKGNDYPYEDVMEYTPQNTANNNYNDVIQSVSTTANVTNQMAFDYLNKIYPALNPILDACVNSENNGGNCKIHDDSLSLNDFEKLFFGMSGNGLTPDPDNGILGAGGILWHFNMSEAKRAELWSDVKTAFNKLKGKAPSTQGTELISFRYDMLVVLRVAKQYLSLERPKPNDQYFTGWVDAHSKKTPVGPVNPENVYPHLLISEKGVTAQNDFFLRLVIADNGNLGVDNSEVVEWTLDTLWESWYPGEYVSGDTNNAVYKATIPSQTIDEWFNGANGYGWVRVTDRCGNSTIEKFTIEGVAYPTVSEAYIEDTEGEGYGNKITVKMILGTADTADELDDFTRFQYAWPNKTPLKDADQNSTTIDNTNNIITVTDNSFNDGAGLGLVSFDYPSKDSIEGDLLDKVGPAIIKDNGAYLYTGAKDTLEITLTEDITENLQADTRYLRFKIGNGNPEEIASDEIIKVSSSKWRFTFTAGTLADKDSVNLIAASGLQDLVSNSPADYNKYRPIKTLGSKEPRWDIGYIKDSDGDGYGDRITVAIIPGPAPDADKPSDVIKYEYSWPDKNNFVEAPVNTITISGNNLAATDNTLTDGAGEGNGRLAFPSATITGTVYDSVGPALIDSAILLEKQNGADPETLIVTFSEPIKENLLDDTTYLKINDVQVLSYTALKTGGNKKWRFILPAGSVQAGDSVNLVTGNNSDGLVAYYPFNGNANDETGNGHHGNVTGGASLTQDRFGKSSSAYSFDGIDDCIIVPDHPQLQLGSRGTICLWVYAETNNKNNAAFISKDGPACMDDLSIGLDMDLKAPNTLCMNFNRALENDILYISEKNTFPEKVWTFICGTWDDNGFALYKNAELINSIAESVTLIADSIPLVIAYEVKTPPLLDHIEGDIDDIRIYNRSLSQAEITRIYNNEELNAGVTIVDLKDNPPLDINQKVPVVKLQKPNSVKDGVYLDENADGIMDSVAITFDTTITREALNALSFSFVWLSSNDNSVTMSVNGPAFSIFDDVKAGWKVSGYDLKQFITSLGATWGQATVIQPNVTTGGMDTVEITNKFRDAMGPVPAKAVFAPAYIDNNTQNQQGTGDIPDTLTVTFSEKIAVPSTASAAWPNPFGYCHAGGSSYDMALALVPDQVSGRAMVFLVIGKDDYPERNSDSIWSVSGADFTDSVGIIQQKTTGKIPLIVKKYHYAYNASAYPNPYNANETDETVLDEIGQAWDYFSIDEEKKGILLIVDPYGYINSKVAVTVSANIYDPVGNTVKRIPENSFTYKSNTRKNQVWYALWNTCNERERIVGQGSYICIISVEERQEGSPPVRNDFPVIIGIKK